MNTRSIIYEFAILEHAYTAYFCAGYIKRCCIKVLLVRSGMNPKRCFISFLSVFLYADLSEPNLICRRSWPSYRTYILCRSYQGVEVTRAEHPSSRCPSSRKIIIELIHNKPFLILVPKSEVDFCIGRIMALVGIWNR